MSMCRRCRAGNHAHDTWTGADGLHDPGSDAGCPFVATPGGSDECTCSYVKPGRKPDRIRELDKLRATIDQLTRRHLPLAEGDSLCACGNPFPCPDRQILTKETPDA